MAEVTLTNVSKSYGTEVALDDVTMTVPDGAFVVLLGPTGAGKTTNVAHGVRGSIILTQAA